MVPMEIMRSSPSALLRLRRCSILPIIAFNYAETYRTPVFILSDAFVGHMREEVIIPEPEKIKTDYRKIPEEGTDPQTIKGFLDEDVAPMPIFGKGFKAHVTSSCHDEVGKRNLIDISALDNYIRKLSNKILKHKEEITLVERDYEGAEIVLVSYGGVARAAAMAAAQAREEGIPVGTLRLITVWPFPEEEIEKMARKAKHVIVLENNLGQMYPYIKAEAAHFAEVSFLASETGRGDSGSGGYLKEDTGGCEMSEIVHPLHRFIRPSVTHTTFCPGCGDGIVVQSILRAIDGLGMEWTISSSSPESAARHGFPVPFSMPICFTRPTAGRLPLPSGSRWAFRTKR